MSLSLMSSLSKYGIFYLGTGGGGGGLSPVMLSLGSWNVTVPTIGLSSELLFNTSTTTDTGSPGFTWSPTAVSLSSIQKISGASSLLISTSSRFYTGNYVGHYTPFNGHTFSIWIYPTSLNKAGSNNIIISNNNTLSFTTTAGFGIYGVGTSSSPMTWIAQYGLRGTSTTDSCANIITLGTDIISLNSWNHIAFSIDSFGYFITLVNGIQYNNPTPTYNLSSVSSTTLCLGCATSSTTGNWAGYIDNFRYYRKSSTIIDLYNLWCEGYTPPLNYSILSNGSIVVKGGCMSFALSNTSIVKSLIVAGGGGGGCSFGGGGGAGGLILKTDSLTTGTYNIAVGNGGNGQLLLNNLYSSALNGGHSIFGSNIAVGGGAGNGQFAFLSQKIKVGNGGSGGGGSRYESGGSVISGQGNSGGNGNNNGISSSGGGGGGAGAVGSNGSNTSGGNGGIGLSNDITGTLTYYAGGGGGSSTQTNKSIGGLGGGGNGDGKSTIHGTFNTGGGGGGNEAYTGGYGGSGIVIFNIQNGNYYISSNTTNYNIYYVRNSINFALTGSRTFYYVAVGPGGAGGGRTDASYFYGGGGGGGIVSGSYTQSGDTSYNITIGSTVLSGTGNSVATSTPTTIVGGALNVSASAGGSVDSTGFSNVLTGGTAGTSSLGLTGFTGITENGGPSAGGTGSSTAGNGTTVTTGYTLNVEGTTFYMSGGGNGSNGYLDNLKADCRFRFDTSFGNITYADDGVSYATCMGTSGTATITSADYIIGTKSLYCNATNKQFIKLTPTCLSITDSGLSFSVWFKSSSTTPYARLFDFNVNGSINAAVNGSQTIAFSPVSGPFLYRDATSNPGTFGNMCNGTWKHVVWTLGPPSANQCTWKIYQNAVELTSTTTPSYPNNMTTYPYPRTDVVRNYLTIGGPGYDPTNGYLECYVDDFRIYNRTLTAAEVTSIYNSTVSTYQVDNNTFGGGVGGYNATAPSIGSVPGGGGGGSANNTRANGGNGGVYLIVPK